MTAAYPMPTIVCSACKGRGHPRCDICHGSGFRKDCPSCGGGGDSQDCCVECVGAMVCCPAHTDAVDCTDACEEEDCEACEGSGKEPCSTCDREGIVALAPGDDESIADVCVHDACHRCLGGGVTYLDGAPLARIERRVSYRAPSGEQLLGLLGLHVPTP